eukprot:TRINITY_DN121009_c0_g1_i1.p1 TRINITY_DN121009_c0_g1~~TRINITY_DN121009_c0_g1_i1.p1  ORF type:complete len:1178 (-),score=210.82 TRINITY_DN121009_c0_g1_i1:49-3582(-)
MPTCYIPIEVDAEEKCSALSGQLFSPSPEVPRALKDVTDGPATASRPSWDDAMWQLMIVPFIVQVCIFFLCVPLGHVYRRMTSRPGYMRQIVDHLGCDEHPLPKFPRFLQVMNGLQMICSGISVCLFISGTYTNHQTLGLAMGEVLLAVFFTVHYMVSLTRLEWDHWEIFHLTQLIDVLTVPNHFNAFSRLNTDWWLSLNFLRAWKAVMAYERVQELGLFRLSGGNVARQVAATALRFTAFVICFAGMIMVVEVLGELPLFAHMRSIPTDMGEITFFEMTYWIIETISTVGYGDYAPHTSTSRFLVILCMISGVAFFTLELNKLLDIMSREKKGAGRFLKTWRKHVVLVGGGVRHVDETMLLAIIEEIYHPRHRHGWPYLVIMTALPDSLKKIQAIVQETMPWEVQHLITFLVGSPLHLVDLQRARCDCAELVLVVADTSSVLDAAEEDKQNILRALSLKIGFPQTPMRLMLLMAESKDRALSVGIWPERCFAIDEVKGGLFWHASRCVGWNAFIAGLLTTIEEKDLPAGAREPWLLEYLKGVEQQVWGFLAVEAYHGRQFRELALEAYRRKGVSVFAVQIDGVVVLSPLKDTVITKDMVFFCIATSQESLDGFQAHQDWKAVFVENRFRLHAEHEDDLLDPDKEVGMVTSVFSMRRSGLTNINVELVGPSLPNGRRCSAGTLQLTTSELSLLRGDRRTSYRGSSERVPLLQNVAGTTPGGRRPVAAAAQQSVEPSPPPPPGIKDAKGDAKAPKEAKEAPKEESSRRSSSASDGASPTSSSEESTGGMGSTALRTTSLFLEATKQAMPSEDISALRKRAAKIRANSDRRPFILLLDLSGSWRQMASFLDQSCADYLPFRVPVIVLSTTPPPKSLFEMLKTDSTTFGLIVGNACHAGNLEEAGVHEASNIVCLGENIESSAGGLDDHMGSELMAMLDADIVMLHRMLERLGAGKRFLILEFKRAKNLRMLPPLRESRQRSNSNGMFVEMTSPQSPVPSHSSEPAIQEDASYAEVLCGHRFAAGQIFTAKVCGSLLSRGFYTPGIIEVLQLLVIPEASEGGCYPWQLCLASWQVGSTYGEVLQHMINDDNLPAMPIGVLRMRGTSQAAYDRYVVTNPPADLVLKENDMLYVLGGKDFGMKANQHHLLPYSGQSQHDRLVSQLPRARSRTRILTRSFQST